MSNALERQAFDSDAFGFPWYRLVCPDAQGLEVEVEGLAAAGPHAIDAKLPAEALGPARRLLALGFRRICTQLELVHPLGSAPANGRPNLPPVTAIEISDSLVLPEELLGRHARNFAYDRFSQDPLLPEAGVRTLYRRWIGNSLSGRKLVVHDGRNFCTYAEREGTWSIDLVSVLDAGRGVGTGLLAALVERGRAGRARSLTVVTECENRSAWRLYLRSGFEPARFTSVFHKVLR